MDRAPRAAGADAGPARAAGGSVRRAAGLLVLSLVPAIVLAPGLQLFLGEPPLDGAARGPGLPSRLLDDQCAADAFGEALLGEGTVSSLAARVARHHAEVACGGEPRAQRVHYQCALIVEQDRRGADVPEHLDPGGRRIHVLPAGSAAARCPYDQLRARYRKDFVDHQLVGLSL